VPTAERPIRSRPGRADEPSNGLESDNHSVAHGREAPHIPDGHDLAASPSTIELQEELLQTRDELIAAEAQLGESLGRIRVLETELGRYQEAAGQLDRLTRSPVWRCQRLYERLRGRVGRIRAVVLGKAR
jgi:hypothetical protein